MPKGPLLNLFSRTVPYPLFKPMNKYKTWKSTTSLWRLTLGAIQGRKVVLNHTILNISGCLPLWNLLRKKSQSGSHIGSKISPRSIWPVQIQVFTNRKAPEHSIHWKAAPNSSKLVTKMIRHCNFSLQSVAEPSTYVVPIHSGQWSCSLESTSNTWDMHQTQHGCFRHFHISTWTVKKKPKKLSLPSSPSDKHYRIKFLLEGRKGGTCYQNALWLFTIQNVF